MAHRNASNFIALDSLKARIAAEQLRYTDAGCLMATLWCIDAAHCLRKGFPTAAEFYLQVAEETYQGKGSWGFCGKAS